MQTSHNREKKCDLNRNGPIPILHHALRQEGIDDAKEIYRRVKLRLIRSLHIADGLYWAAFVHSLDRPAGGAERCLAAGVANASPLELLRGAADGARVFGAGAGGFKQT